jgi:hypothetical protein
MTSRYPVSAFLQGKMAIHFRSWPGTEIDFKPGKLSAAKFAKFAVGSFVALHWRSIRGQLLPPSTAGDQSSVRLLYSDTCRNPYASNSAIADVGDQRHEGLQCACKRPVERLCDEIQNLCCRWPVSKNPSGGSRPSADLHAACPCKTGIKVKLSFTAMAHREVLGLYSRSSCEPPTAALLW